MKQVELASGHRLHVIDEGTGCSGAPALVFLHALGTDASLWQAQRQALASSHRLVSIEAPGHGASPPWPEVSLHELASAVWQVADHLQLERLRLVGTSMGAVIALQAAALQPQRVRQLVLCGARLVRAAQEGEDLRVRSRLALHDDLAKVADGMLARWFPVAANVPDTLRLQVREMLARTSPQGYAACARACESYDLVEALRQNQQHTWLVAGEHDEDVPAHFRALAADCPGVRLLLLEGVGHFPALERPEVFNALLADAALGQAP